MATTVGSVTAQFFADVTIDAASVPATSTQSETFTVAGLKVDQVVVVNAPSLNAGLFVISAFVSAANTLTLVFQNVTGGALNPSSQAFKVVAL